MNGHAERLTVEIPQRLLQRRCGGPQEMTGGSSRQLPAQGGYVRRILTDELRSQAMANGGGEQTVIAGVGRFPQADEALIGVDADEEPVAAPVDPDADGLDGCDLHCAVPPDAPRAAGWRSRAGSSGASSPRRSFIYHVDARRHAE